MIVGIHHVAVGVPDLQRGIAFYRDVLGFEVLSEGKLENNPTADRCIGLNGIKAGVAMLKAPNAYIEMWSYSDPAPENLGSRPCDFGYPHFALQVTEINEEYQRMRSLGMEFMDEPVDFGTASAIYGKDPFGNIIEIYEIRDAQTPQL